MNKAELKQLYGHYGDVEKLVDDICALLTKYMHNNAEDGVCAMLDKFFRNKKDLIELIASSEKYIGDFRLVTDIDLDRTIDRAEIQTAWRNLITQIDFPNFFAKFVDEDGKQLEDYLVSVKPTLSVHDFKNENIFEELLVKKTMQFNRTNGRTKKSMEDQCACRDLLEYFRRYFQTTISSDAADNFKGRPVKIGAGLKTSRAVNKICMHYGIDKVDGYNKAFARYADTVSDLKRTMKFFISVNPLDYLMMSFGYTWSSCHTIDKRNIRGVGEGYHGMYCGGTLSYMLDKTSIITFVHNDIPENFEDGKIYRNMFHYNNGFLVQGRIYPQGNDGATDLYKTFRSVMQKEVADMLKIENKWTLSKTRPSDSNINSYGVHYRDYEHYSGCNISFVQEMQSGLPSGVLMDIGTESVCVKCGEEFERDGYLVCDDCE